MTALPFSVKIQSLTTTTLLEAVEQLAIQDEALASIYVQFGPPPLWAREPGFPTLIHIILEQQVSLASARAAMDRLLVAVSPLTPQGFLALDDATLKTIGFSRQKTGYGRGLAQAILDGRLDLQALEKLDDDAVRSQLVSLKGIGRWSADIYLLMALCRPDIWPHGDLALAAAAQQVYSLPSRPTYDELTAMSERWRPWRAIAARLLWHYYLSQR
jgi:DNA-3-methyladenine glycosylase II